MARYTHKTSGARVQVRDDKVMDSSWQADTDSEAEAGGDGYEAMRVADLRAEIERRNEGRDETDRMAGDGKKADLVAALQLDDAARTEL